MVLIEA
jgi:hypothetical protein